MDQDDVYSCKCCLNIYNNPVLLECGHSICMICAERLLAFHTLCIAKTESPHNEESDVQETWTENDVMLCPVCSQPTALLEKGADSLPLDTKLKSEVEQYASAQHAPSICGFGCGKHANVECLVCKCPLCTECCEELHSKPAFQGHEIGSLGEIDRRKNPLCISHNKELSMFCTVCKGMVCVLCVTTGDTHKNHTCISTEEYVETCQEELIQGTDLLRARHAQLMISFLAIERLLSDIQTTRENFAEEVEHVFGVLISELELRKQEILTSAASSGETTIERLSKQASCLMLIAQQIDSIAQNIQKTSSSKTQPVSALISSKRDMVNALKCFDIKQLCLSPCASAPDYYKLNPKFILEDILKFGHSVMDTPGDPNYPIALP